MLSARVVGMDLDVRSSDQTDTFISQCISFELWSFGDVTSGISSTLDRLGVGCSRLPLLELVLDIHPLLWPEEDKLCPSDLLLLPLVL
jgi:hypothetical protein